MSRDGARLAVVLGELADLGRRISERAAELAALVVEGGSEAPPDLVDRLADVQTSTADLAAAAAGVTAAADTATPSPRDATAATPQGAAGARATRGARRPSASRRLPRSRSRGPSAVVTSHRPVAAQGRRRLRPIMPALVSVAVNVAVILGLAVIFIAADVKPKRPVLTLAASEETFVDEMAAVEFPATDEVAQEVEQPADLLPELDALAADAVAIDDVSLDAEAFAADSEAVMPASFDAADILADVGGAGGSGDGAAGSPREGGSAGGGPPGAAAFFGRAGQGQTVCFICDNSNSYRDGGFHVVLDEVARAVDSLRPDQSFFVVFFSDDAYPMFHPEPVAGLQSASPENKRRLRAWLATVQMCGGGQGIDEAVKIASQLEADVVYFLSDGEHAASVVERVATADFGGAVVHTFGMQQGVVDRRTGRIDPAKLHRQQEFDRNLIAIATAHGGGFTPVMVPPQAAMLERLRPIPKNRAPGPVWGLKL
jgi:hypothetical protein